MSRSLFFKCATVLMCGATLHAKADTQLFTLEESRAYIKDGLPTSGETVESAGARLYVLKRINPAITTEIFRTLADRKQREYWTNCIELLTHIATAEDIQSLLKWSAVLDESYDDLNMECYRRILNLLVCDSDKGGKNSKAMLLKFSSLEYWENRSPVYKATWYDDIPRSCRMAEESIRCLGYLADINLEEIESTIKKTKHDATRSRLENTLKAAKWIQSVWPKAKESYDKAEKDFENKPLWYRKRMIQPAHLTVPEPASQPTTPF